MRLQDIVRKRFMPPDGGEAYDKYDSSVIGYAVDSIRGKIAPVLKRMWSDGGELFTYADNKDSGLCYTLGDIAESDIRTFDSMEEAREFCWDNFELCYRDSAVNKEPG